MGMPAAEIEANLDRLVEEISEVPDEEEGEDPDDLPDPARLLPPRNLAPVEAAWRRTLPEGIKPFPFLDESPEAMDAWEPETTAAWLSFLREHPEALDSLDILDDLATLVLNHPAEELDIVWRLILIPLLRRATAIVQAAVPDTPEAPLDWGLPENRIAIRPFVRLAALYLSLDNPKAGEVMECYLRMNPADHHAIRAPMINLALGAGYDEYALELANRFPEDILPPVLFGRALALYRLKRTEEARDALRRANRQSPLVAGFLISPSPRIRPLQRRRGRAAFDLEAARRYREEMRKTWEESPGALEWLEKNTPGSLLVPDKKKGGGRKKRR